MTPIEVRCIAVIQAWSYLNAAVRLGKELKVWSLQNDALLCKFAFIKRTCLIVCHAENTYV